MGVRRIYCCIHVHYIYVCLCADQRISDHIHSYLVFDLVPDSFVHDAIRVRDTLYKVGNGHSPVWAPFLPFSHHPFLSLGTLTHREANRWGIAVCTRHIQVSGLVAVAQHTGKSHTRLLHRKQRAHEATQQYFVIGR
ncbi:hypothetical protein BD310DRAFT_935125 [Dichomitus squalens]|uniref:Uncharacterized protein n=1 Tax=Dichomitus squalens TaxID=114155 RepID=A0A4Q9PKW2_9APHY|nr:hypothetical protein BD310DRAFT_935125 [Dichomitus squalens]